MVVAVPGTAFHALKSDGGLKVELGLRITLTFVIAPPSELDGPAANAIAVTASTAASESTTPPPSSLLLCLNIRVSSHRLPESVDSGIAAGPTCGDASNLGTRGPLRRREKPANP